MLQSTAFATEFFSVFGLDALDNHIYVNHLKGYIHECVLVSVKSVMIILWDEYSNYFNKESFRVLSVCSA
jgi:hypothetical protein